MRNRITFLFTLDAKENWALGADNQQWMVMRWKRPDWRPVSFVASKKRVVMRVLDEKGIALTENAITRLNALPERFLDWRDGLKARVI